MEPEKWYLERGDDGKRHRIAPHPYQQGAKYWKPGGLVLERQKRMLNREFSTRYGVDVIS